MQTSPCKRPYRTTGGVKETMSFFNLAARWWSTPLPGRFNPGKETRYPFCTKMGGHHGRSGQMRKILPTSGFDPRTVQPAESRCTDYAILFQKQVKWKHRYDLTETDLRHSQAKNFTQDIPSLTKLNFVTTTWRHNSWPAPYSLHILPSCFLRLSQAFFFREDLMRISEPLSFSYRAVRSD
jgi:hypothetical protein